MSKLPTNEEIDEMACNVFVRQELAQWMRSQAEPIIEQLEQENAKLKKQLETACNAINLAIDLFDDGLVDYEKYNLTEYKDILKVYRNALEKLTALNKAKKEDI